jgi:hypothetical protein
VKSASRKVTSFTTAQRVETAGLDQGLGVPERRVIVVLAEELRTNALIFTLSSSPSADPHVHASTPL